MADNPSAPLLGAEQSSKPSSIRSQGSKRSQHSQHSRNSDESRPLLADDSDHRDYGDAPQYDDAHSPAASSLRSLNTGSTKKRPWRWPSIIALTILSLLILVILGLGFAAPSVMQEYAKEAVVFEPTGLSIESFTSTGVQVRVQGDIKMDGTRVHKKPVRDLGRAGSWIAKAVQSKQSHIEVYLPDFSDVLVGTADIPSIIVNIRDGATTHVDFVSDLSAGDLNGLKDVAQNWVAGKIKSLNVRALAKVSLKTGIFDLGEQEMSETMTFGGNDLPTIPQYNIARLNFHDVEVPEIGNALEADVSIIISNDYPFRFDIPPLGFNVLVPGCTPDVPLISVADAYTKSITVEPKQDISVYVNGLVKTLSGDLTATCPNVLKSPLDTLVGDYIHGSETRLYVRGSEAPVEDTPQWISEFLQSIILPVDFQGKTFENLIRNFSLEDVHFSLPNPFSGPDSPDSKPRVSATVQALVGLPDEMNFAVNVNHVRANSDIFYQGKKLGELDLSKWQDANSTRVEAHGSEKAGLAVSSIVDEAPINVTDNAVFSKVIQAVAFGGKKVVLSVKANVDVETVTVLGHLVLRGIPAEGSVFVNPLSTGGNDLKAIAPQVGFLEILETARSSLKLGAKVNITNPTEYSATVPYLSIRLLNNGTELGDVYARNVEIKPGTNYNISVEAVWNPKGRRGAAQGREVLSQYVSGFNVTLSFRTHAGTIPTQPALGLALSQFPIDIPAPSLNPPRKPSKPGDERGPDAPSFIDDATFHIFTSTATFTILSPLRKTSLFVTHLNATAFYNHTEPVGSILYDLPFEVPPGISESPNLPVDWDLAGVGYQGLKDAVGGRLKLDAKANANIKIDNWEQDLWVLGRGIGAHIRL
ncbi:uncharacterized protein KY384_006863 [Bacidia gigantensis]|uniref:uncharacterized protein n=1 Tax=Bacidia gigantensis TaxID=2732470 RepID=UPI001D03A095|nr:uncharacterized protein KY384_006863 [Bacidia gigantensis]KAG8527947.1 hypothetical protein KY384_006863 [Bacidia gigantensis]